MTDIVFCLRHSVLVLTRVRQGYRTVRVRRGRRRRTGGGGCQVPTKPGERGGGREGEWKTGIRPPPLYTRQPRRGGHMCVCLAYALPPPLSCVRAGESVYVPPLPLAAGRGADGGGWEVLAAAIASRFGSVGRGGAAFSNWDFFLSCRSAAPPFPSSYTSVGSRTRRWQDGALANIFRRV